MGSKMNKSGLDLPMIFAMKIFMKSILRCYQSFIAISVTLRIFTAVTHKEWLTTHHASLVAGVSVMRTVAFDTPP